MSTKNKTKFINNLSKLRIQKGYTQTELAEKLKPERDGKPLNRRTISQWETGSTLIPLDRLIELADLFGVSADYLLNRSADYKSLKNYQIGKLTGLSEGAIIALKSVKSNLDKYKDGRSQAILRTLNAIIENESNEEIELLQTIDNCIFADFELNGKMIDGVLKETREAKKAGVALAVDRSTQNVQIFTGKTLRNAFLGSVTARVVELRHALENPRKRP